MPAKLPCAFLLSALTAMAAASPASAQQNTSQSTSVALKNCLKFKSIIVHGGEFGAEYDCPGIPGYRVYRLEYDGRTTIGIGFNRFHASRARAAQQMFAPFSEVHDKMEWRIDPKTKKPFAAILRWTISDYSEFGKNEPPKMHDFLIVIRTPPGLSCHAAYVDIGANPDANELALKAADEFAKNVKCLKDKVRILGNRGRAIELAGQ